MPSDGRDERLRTSPPGSDAASPPLFVERRVTLAAGSERPYERREWADSLVLVKAGEIELECLGGACRSFGAGALLCFDPLPLRVVRNSGRETALLIAISRFRAGR